MTEILVIKLGALGDFAQAFGPFAAIRAHHRHARITLLTTPPFRALAERSPWFDQVWCDAKPKFWQVGRVLALRALLRSLAFDRVYDLQTSDRSGFYFRLMGGRVPWSGIAKGCTLPHTNIDRDHMHTIERQAEQLQMAGLKPILDPDLSWVVDASEQFSLTPPYALICPGGAPHRPAKRWPADRFGALCCHLADQGITPVLLGTPKEQAALDAILAVCPDAVNLGGRTSFLDILGLGRGALLAVGNDTGPMHLIALAGCPVLSLFGGESNPALCAPRGQVTVLKRQNLDQLSLDAVKSAVSGLIS